MKTELLSLYRNDILSVEDAEKIEKAINSGEIFTDEIKDDFIDWVSGKVSDEDILSYTDENYENLLSHKENYAKLKNHKS